MIEKSIFFSIFILVIIAYALIYYKKILYAQKEYENSKEIVKSIILTFKTKLNKQNDKIENILKYITSNQNFTYFCKTIGYVDLEFALYLNNSFQLNQIMENLSSKFPDAIKNYTYFSFIKIHKAYGFLNTAKRDLMK